MAENKVHADLASDAEAEPDELEETAQTETETLTPSRESRGSYAASRFNALRHGLLSVHTVLPWESQAEYTSLLQALVEEYAPSGPSEEHLIEEIAGVIWRKRRLRLAEAAAYRRGLERTTDPLSNTISTALVQVEGTGSLGTIMTAVTAKPSETVEDLVVVERCKAAAQSALEILRAGGPGAYEIALSQLDEATRRSWQEEVAPELENLDQDEDADPNHDEEPYTADPAALADYLESWVLPRCARQRTDIENRPVIRAQALGEALAPERLEPLTRYEVHLDRKLERMLTMLMRLQSLRRSVGPA